MFAKHTNHKTRLTVAPQQLLVAVPSSSTSSLRGEAHFPSPPALANTLLQLELHLSRCVVDLREVTNMIRSDIGLTTQLLRLAAAEIQASPDRIVSLSEIVVCIWVDRLKELIAQTSPLQDNVLGHAGSTVARRFWTHSQLTALVAEELAYEFPEVQLEEAYMAGLLWNLGELPLVLGWPSANSAAGSHHLGYRMANAWGFPRALADVIGGNREVCITRESRALVDIAMSASSWAFRLEFLAARESPSLRAKNPPYRIGRD
jgi:HD-like signal output (HDOD) protein